MNQHPLQTMIDSLLKRDANQIEEMSSFYGGGSTIENRIELANGRAKDALHAVITLANYIMEHEK